MFTLLRRQRKIITSFALVVWFLALFIGIAHACGLGEPTTAPPAVGAVDPGERPADTGTPNACEQFCKTDVPVVSKLQFLGDQPDAPPLIIAVREIGVAVAPPPALRLAPAAHPPPDAAAFLRFAHLRL